MLCLIHQWCDWVIGEWSRCGVDGCSSSLLLLLLLLLGVGGGVSFKVLWMMYGVRVVTHSSLRKRNGEASSVASQPTHLVNTQLDCPTVVSWMEAVLFFSLSRGTPDSSLNPHHLLLKPPYWISPIKYPSSLLSQLDSDLLEGIRCSLAIIL